jgi:glycerate 2-kinase
MARSPAVAPSDSSLRILAAPDKFRGSLSTTQVAGAIALGAVRAGQIADELPLADGGEGTLDALGGANRHSLVTGPLGDPVEAPWRLDDGVAVVEMAKASGLALVGGSKGNDPLGASTRGTGELIAAALRLGAERVIVGLGGSATSDGGLGAVEVLRDQAPFPVPVEVACDVTTLFLDAAAVYGPQKGATPEQVEILAARLHALSERYLREFRVDVSCLSGGGAAGGLAGGLAALGAELMPGFELVAETVGLESELDQTDLVVTGEGLLDATSFAGKVVGGVVQRAAENGVPVLIVVGDIAPGVTPPLATVSLVERFGTERAWGETEECIACAVTEALSRYRRDGGSVLLAPERPGEVSEL